MKALLFLILLLIFITPASMGQVHKEDQARLSQRLSGQIAFSANDASLMYKHLAEYHRKHLDPQATLACYDVLRQHPKNPVLKAAFAFLCFRATQPVSVDYNDYNKKTPRLDAIVSLHTTAARCREEAAKELPRSPEVLLEAGIAECYEPSADYTGRLKGNARIKQAVELAPDWADAHFWLADTLSLLEGKIYADASRDRLDPKIPLRKLAEKEIFHYDKAEKLDPSFHTACLLGHAFAYSSLAQPTKAHEALESYIKINPWFLDGPGVVQWREQIAKSASKAQNSSAKTAN